jgi:hypothetical protein
MALLISGFRGFEHLGKFPCYRERATQVNKFVYRNGLVPLGRLLFQGLDDYKGAFHKYGDIISSTKKVTQK